LARVRSASAAAAACSLAALCPATRLQFVMGPGYKDMSFETMKRYQAFIHSALTRNSALHSSAEQFLLCWSISKVILVSCFVRGGFPTDPSPLLGPGVSGVAFDVRFESAAVLLRSAWLGWTPSWTSFMISVMFLWSDGISDATLDRVFAVDASNFTFTIFLQDIVELIEYTVSSKNFDEDGTMQVAPSARPKWMKNHSFYVL
jgi:hypothetical protein